MKGLIRKTLALTATAITIFSIAACNKTGTGSSGNGSESGRASRNMTINVASSLVDYSKYRDTVSTDIYAWRGPTDLTDERWQEFKDSGINTLIVDSTLNGARGSQFGSAMQEKYIEKCHEFGIGAIGYTNGNINKNIKDYRGKDFYSSIKGIDYTDEPNMSEYEEIAGAIADFSVKYPGGKFFVCMNSSGADARYLGTSDYREYIGGWYDSVLSLLPEGMPRVMAIDVYPLHDAQRYDYNYVEETWLRSLAFIGEQKIAHPELITHLAMQSMSFGFKSNTSPRRLPDETDCIFQAYVAMAFGFTEFSWFTYSSPELDEREFGEEHVSMIDRNGARTSAYGGVKAANSLIFDLDEVMQSITWKGVYPVEVKGTSGSEKKDEWAFKYLKSVKSVILEESDFDTVKSVKATANAICSRFTDENGNEGLMLVNYGDPSYGKSNTVDIEFIDCDKVVVYRDGKATVEDVKNGKWSETVSAGKGVFVVPYKA